MGEIEMRQKHKRTDKAMERRKALRKGTPNRKVIGKVVDGGREYTLHATKGYRSHTA